MDRIGAARRSANMAKIKGKDTKIEVAVRSFLHRRGFRFRKNDRRYPGKPDALLPKHRTAVFVNGCFWHAHEGCPKARVPKSNREYWEAKLLANAGRDRRNEAALREAGWRVETVWECELEADFEGRMEELCRKILENGKEWQASRKGPG